MLTLPTTSHLIHLLLPKFHYRLGMILYSITKGRCGDNLLFSIVVQIKHGIRNLAEESPELRIDIAKLFELSGSKAAASSDHAASCSYLNSALSLLPPDHWKSHYDLSLQIYLRLANSCYSCGDLGKAQCILQEMTPQCLCIEHKVPGHLLLAKSEYNCYRLLR
jgi:predicted ATPase